MPRPSPLPSAVRVPALGAVLGVALAAVPALGAPSRNTATVGAVKASWPALGLEYERAVGERFSASGFGSLGRFEPLLLPLAEKAAKQKVPPLSYRELGGRFQWYVGGDFEKGWQLGSTLRWTRYSVYQSRTQTVSHNKTDETGEVTQTAKGRANMGMIGAHTGYKRTFGPGFTAQATLGWGYFYLQGRGSFVAEAYGQGAGPNATVVSTGPTPFGNLGIGWSF